ncbi:MAG: hypothetical protein ACRCZI_05790 [Cetobacterium sp.]
MKRKKSNIQNNNNEMIFKRIQNIIFFWNKYKRFHFFYNIDIINMVEYDQHGETNPQRRKNNPDDQLGYEMAIEDACVNGDAKNWDSTLNLLPDNNEYEISKLDVTCNYCIGCNPRRMSFGSGWNSLGRHANWDGRIPHYRRKGYTAPKDDCCFEPGVKTIGNKTCDPKFRKGPYSADCEDVYLNKCNNANEIFKTNCNDFCDNGRSDKCKNMLNYHCTGKILSDGNATCSNWCDKNPELCNTRIREYCVGSNLDKQYCKDKLVKIGYSDDSVNQWCMTHANDPFCACFNALIDSEKIEDKEVKKVLARPECYVAACASGGGYRYTNMRDGESCPPVNVCVNKIIVAGNTYTNLENIKQECDQTIGVNNTINPTNFNQTQTPESTNTSIDEGSENSNKSGIENYESLGPITQALSDLLGKKIDFMGGFTVELMLLILITFLLIIGISISLNDSPEAATDLQKSSLFDSSETLV